MPLPVNPGKRPSAPTKAPEAKAERGLPSLEEIKERNRRREDAKPIVRNRRPKDRSGTPSDLPKGWDWDPKTGKRFKTIPKSEYDSEGTPILHLEDLDLDNLNGEADKYLAHLRVPPNKEEMARLRKEKAERTRASNAVYQKMNPEDDE